VTHWQSTGGLKLAGHLALPESRRVRALPGVVLCPGFPAAANGGSRAAERVYPLADRIARNMEWAALVLNYRGCGDSEGDFSLGAWAEDVRSAVGYMNGLEQVEGVWSAGFGIGGALAAHAARDDLRVRGVATMGAPADFDHWELDASRVVEYARSLGIISASGFPESVDSWAQSARSIRADRCAAEIAPGRCWYCTVPTTRRYPLLMPGPSPTLTAMPACASLAAPTTASTPTPAASPSSWAGSTLRSPSSPDWVQGFSASPSCWSRAWVTRGAAAKT